MVSDFPAGAERSYGIYADAGRCPATGTARVGVVVDSLFRVRVLRRQYTGATEFKAHVWEAVALAWAAQVSDIYYGPITLYSDCEPLVGYLTGANALREPVARAVLTEVTRRPWLSVQYASAKTSAQLHAAHTVAKVKGVKGRSKHLVEAGVDRWRVPHG